MGVEARRSAEKNIVDQNYIGSEEHKAKILAKASGMFNSSRLDELFSRLESEVLKTCDPSQLSEVMHLTEDSSAVVRGLEWGLVDGNFESVRVIAVTGTDEMIIEGESSELLSASQWNDFDTLDQAFRRASQNPLSGVDPIR